MKKNKEVNLNFRGGAVLLLSSLLLSPTAGLTASAAPDDGIELLQQSRLASIKGTVVDTNGEPMIGVVVKTADGKANAITDLNGNFTLRAATPATVIITSIGYETQTIRVKNAAQTLKIKMAEDEKVLEDVVVVGYGTQKKVSVTGAVSSVGTKDLTQSSTSNMATALAGRLPGLTTMQSAGQPGANDVTLYLRGAATVNGTSPLILIDGVPREDLYLLDPNEVESVSVLKDASATAVFGVRGANGVIIITTKRGQVGKMELSVNATYSLQDFVCKPSRLHSWEFAELRNQAHRNDGLPEESIPFTDYMIEQYKSGANPDFYPDRDVQSEYYKHWAPQTKINVNMSGGTDKVKYFLNAAYLGQKGQLKTESEKELGYNANFYNDRYSFRGNLDYQIAKGLKMSLNLATYLEKVNAPALMGGSGGTSDVGVLFSRSIWEINPTMPGPITAAGHKNLDGDDVKGGQILEQFYGQMNRVGYSQQFNSNLNTSFALDWDLGFLTKGLSTKLLVAFDTKGYTNRYGTRSYDYYQPEVSRTADGANVYREMSMNNNDALFLSKSAASNYYLNVQYSINYDRTFGKHQVTGLGLVQRDNWQYYSADLPYNMLGVSGRATYAYDSKYLAEVNVGYNGSEQFAKGHRFGFFPAMSLGWIISNEKFLQDNKVLTYLKLRGSYGKVGNDKLGDSRFLYLDNMLVTPSYNIPGNDYPSCSNTPGLGNGQLVATLRKGNPDIGWEIAYKQNYGVDIRLWNDLSLSFDYFREDRKNILIGRGTVPEICGIELATLPKVNMGEVVNKGFEVEATYNKVINKDFSFSLRGNFAYARNKVTYTDEVAYPESYAYQYHYQGFSIFQEFGWLIDWDNGGGYLNTPEDLEWAKKAYPNDQVRLGDFRYKDLNGDGKIDDGDRGPCGYDQVPRITYGFSGNLQWKDLDFSFVFSGIAKCSSHYDKSGVYENSGKGFYTGAQLHAWTEERYKNGEKIEYPALSTVVSMSCQQNDFFIANRRFLRLKNVELGYSLPKAWTRKANIQRIRIFASGNNLLTLFKKMPFNHIDPEQSRVGSYPILKTISFGANVTF